MATNKGAKPNKRSGLKPLPLPKTKEEITRRDYDFLTMSPVDAGKKYKTAPHNVSSRKTQLYKIFGKGYKPDFPAPTEEQTRQPRTQSAKSVVREGEPGFRDKKAPATNGNFEMPIITAEGTGSTVKYGGVTFRLPFTPKSVRVNPTKQTLDLE
jgi:hypothetical protein